MATGTEPGTPGAADPAQVAAPAQAARGAQPAGACFTVVRGPGKGHTWLFPGPPPEGGWVIGRVPGADIQLRQDPYVSGRHAVVGPAAAGGMALRDEPGNRNGTSLNWARLQRGGTAALAPGDLITVGMSLLRYEPAGPPAKRPPRA